MNDGKKIFTNVIKGIAGGTLIAVSYTHLDVYKRQRVDSGEMKVAFAMYPTSIDQLMSIADENKIMPPKSTWFEPKLRSGLFIHSLE